MVIGQTSHLVERIADQFCSKVFVFSDPFLYGRKCPDHLDAARISEKDRVKDIVECPEYQPYFDITRKPV